MTTRASIDDWIRRAFEGAEECPPAEAYLAEELAALEPAARERLESHARTCAACAAERELARAFEADARPHERRDVESIARRLERRPPHGRRADGGWWSISWTDLVRRPAFQLAAAAVLVIGVGVAVRDAATPPSLGPGPDASSMRSSMLEVVAPVGELAAMPGTLAWRAAEGAVTYRVAVLGVDDAELWSAETEATEIAIDKALRARLRAAVWYGWTVEAFDAAGNRIAWSSGARFRVTP